MLFWLPWLLIFLPIYQTYGKAGEEDCCRRTTGYLTLCSDPGSECRPPNICRESYFFRGKPGETKRLYLCLTNSDTGSMGQSVTPSTLPMTSFTLWEVSPMVEELHAKAVGITQISEGAFSGGTEIHTVDLSDNSISDVRHILKSLETIPKLQSLSLKNNPIEVLPTMFSTLNLKYLFLQGARLSHRSIHNNSIPQTTIFLELSENPLDSLEFIFRNTLSSLETLSVNGCNLTAFPGRVSALSPKLGHISLNKNKLGDTLNAFSSDSFSTLRSLRSLSISNSELTTLSWEVFSSVIEQLKARPLEENTGDPSLQLYDNQIYCDGEMTWIKLYASTELASVTPPQCKSPPWTAGQPIYTFKGTYDPETTTTAATTEHGILPETKKRNYSVIFAICGGVLGVIVVLILMVILVKYLKSRKVAVAGEPKNFSTNLDLDCIAAGEQRNFSAIKYPDRNSTSDNEYISEEEMKDWMYSCGEQIEERNNIAQADPDSQSTSDEHYATEDELTACLNLHERDESETYASEDELTACLKLNEGNDCEEYIDVSMWHAK